MAIWLDDLKSDKSDVLVAPTTAGEDPQSWWMHDREAFWLETTRRLGIRFSQTADTILDQSKGVAQAIWFPGAKLNIVESCFQAEDSEVAIIAQRFDGPIRKTTFADLRALTNRVSNSVVAAGFKPGDALAVLMPMTELSVAIYLGVIQAGCAIVSIADSFAPPEIATRLQISNAKAVFTYDCQMRSGRSLELYARVDKSLDIPAIVLPWQSELTCELREQDISWETFLSDDIEFDPIICDSQDTINILFSSGTTGEPKAIPWSQLTPIKCAIDGYCHQDIKPGFVCVWPTNLGWMMGPWLIFASLINRATIGLYEDAPMGEGFGRFVQDAKVNMLGVVPTIVRAWRNSESMEQFDWSAIHTFSSTGESSQRDDMFYLSALAGIRPVIEYCGGTEIGGGYITSSVQYPNAPGVFNTPAVGLDFLILDEDEQPADAGEIYLVGPSIGLSTELLNRDHFETYYGDTPNVEGYQTLRRHGDHFQRLRGTDARFHFYAAGGRVDDTMNLGGIKISSAEIERVLNLLDGVRETAAVAISAQGGPSELVVFVVGENELDLSKMRDEMTAQIRRNLNPLFKISGVQLVDSLPRTASGKVMRRQLRTMVRDKST